MIITIAIRAFVILDHSQPVVMIARNPSSKYVTGLYFAAVANHPDSASFGKNEVVKNENGKNSRKEELTAAGLPVFRAMA